jgi:hypothetical protein
MERPLTVELIKVQVRSAAEIEPTLATIARQGGNGLLGLPDLSFPVRSGHVARERSLAAPPCCAISGSRIRGELLMLGFEVAQSTVSKYMVRGGSPSQGWKTFLRNHAQAIAAIDLCVVPTLTFERLFAFLVLGHGRRQLLWFEVTRHPTAEWLGRQITEAFPWASAPAYLVRDNDRAYGLVFTSRVRAIGHPRPTDLVSIALAKFVCRASDWYRAARVPGPGADLRRGAPAADSFFVCTWRLAKTRPQDGQSSGPAPLSLSRSCPGCTTIMSGYDFRKGHVAVSRQHDRAVGAVLDTSRGMFEIARCIRDLASLLLNLLRGLLHSGFGRLRGSRAGHTRITPGRRRSSAARCQFGEMLDLVNPWRVA